MFCSFRVRGGGSKDSVHNVNIDLDRPIDDRLGVGLVEQVHEDLALLNGDTILSFGYKYGIPSDADLVFDVRFLPNPYYVEGLRAKTGNDSEIQEYVLQFDEAHTFLDKLEDMIQFLIPNYIAEGKSQLVIAVGCTGGKHRSVTLANELYKRLSNTKDYGLRIEHRDITKDAQRGK